jgi:hypothetical protein
MILSAFGPERLVRAIGPQAQRRRLVVVVEIFGDANCVLVDPVRNAFVAGPAIQSVEIGCASGNSRSYSSLVMSCVMKHHSASAPQGSWIVGSM